MSIKVKEFFDKETFTLTYIVWDPKTKDSVLIDPVLNYDSASSSFDFSSVSEAENFIKANELNLHYILETHAHADHLSGSQELKNRFPLAKIAIGEKITAVQEVFAELFHLGDEFPTNGSQFDLLLKDNSTLTAGTLTIKTIATPGHTPACSSYLIDEEALFVGDAIFMPDYGTGRCDFPKGDAEALFHSITKRIYTLPDDLKIFVGHDYQPGGRELQWMTSVDEEKRDNIQLKESTAKEEFVKFRTERDKTLSAPRLLLPSVQFNINAGRMPQPESNGVSYLKLPLRRRK